MEPRLALIVLGGLFVIGQAVGQFGRRTRSPHKSGSIDASNKANPHATDIAAIAEPFRRTMRGIVTP